MGDPHAAPLTRSGRFNFFSLPHFFCNSVRLLLLERSEDNWLTPGRKTGGCFKSPPPQQQNRMKGINEMKTTTNLKSTSRRHLSSLGLLLATVTLLAFVPRSARASGEKPFHANFITQVTTVLEFPILHVTVNSRGQATYMGRTTAFTDDQIQNVIDGSGSATYTLTGKNGDTLVLALLVPVGGTINVEGGVIFSGSYTITGGTGRFNGATGNGVFGGSGLFLTETDGIGAFAVVGTISAPEGLK
jgi:hypothetical protein